MALFPQVRRLLQARVELAALGLRRRRQPCRPPLVESTSELSMGIQKNEDLFPLVLYHGC
jgi:hypothetical protein